MKNFFALAAMFLFAGPASAKSADNVLEEKFFSTERSSLEEVLNIKTSVASRAPLELRKTPGIVTVITAEDIRLSGARNLVDILRQVSDFEFVSDVQGNIGIAVRGNSAIEGKVRLIWDGQTYNEVLYGTAQYDRAPIDQIERIEIIKGPGSVVYGGLGEMAIINIVTKSADHLKGSNVYAGYGQMKNGWGRKFGGYQFGTVKGDTSFSVMAHASSAQRSDRTYRDFAGGSYSMDGDSELLSKNLNVSLQKKNFSVRLIADDYSLLERDHWGTVLTTGAAKIRFPVVSMELKDSLQVSESLRLEPRFAFQYSKPWNEDDEHFSYDKKVKALTGGITASYDTCPFCTVMGGAEFRHEEIDVGDRTDSDSSYSGGKTFAQYDNLAAFAEASVDFPIFMVTAGSRLDVNSHNGTDISPRIALTRREENFHFKAIYSGGFRAPTVENIRLTPAIKPEQTTALELETGYVAGDKFFISANAFDITIKDTILYYPLPVEDYVNSGKTGTRGYGLDIRFDDRDTRIKIAYTAYSADKNTVSYTKVPQNSSYMLGLPRHKAVLASRHKLSGKVTLSPSLTYLSKRYGYYATGAVKPYDELFLADIYLHTSDILTRGLELGLGIYDIFGAGYSYIQSYNGGHAPLPAESREIFLKAAYAF